MIPFCFYLNWEVFFPVPVSERDCAGPVLILLRTFGRVLYGNHLGLGVSKGCFLNYEFNFLNKALQMINFIQGELWVFKELIDFT